MQWFIFLQTPFGERNPSAILPVLLLILINEIYLELTTTGAAVAAVMVFRVIYIDATQSESNRPTGNPHIVVQR